MVRIYLWSFFFWGVQIGYRIYPRNADGEVGIKPGCQARAVCTHTHKEGTPHGDKENI